LSRIRSHNGPIDKFNKYANQIYMQGSRGTKQGFNSTKKRDVNSTLIKDGMPGPGAYDVSFKEVIKMMDQKLAYRYQISPFGSGKPRFNGNFKGDDGKLSFVNLT
jgi:hypothetical protein